MVSFRPSNMVEGSGDSWMNSSSSFLSPSDPLRSSDTGRKIRRNFFKKDVAVKAYKCEFVGSDLTTAAKVYVSNSALYIVHRPKRKKLTTIFFVTINEIKRRYDNQGVDIYLENNLTYSLINFQRRESSIAFLLNFWNLVRNDKTRSSQSYLENSSSTGRFSATSSCDARLSLMSSDPSPKLRKAPTTVSLNSTPSVSETGSLDEQSGLSGSSSKIKSPSNDSKSSVNNLDGLPNIKKRQGSSSGRGSDRFKPRPSPLVVNSQNDKTAPDRLEVMQHSTTTIPFLRVDTPTVSSPCQAEQPNRTTMTTRATPEGPISSSTPTTTTMTGRPRARLPETATTTGLTTIWPLSFLPHPLSSPPQQLTMLIAYAILVFLLLSTLHLYHRLAVFDLHGRARLLQPPSSSSSAVNEFLTGVEYLEDQLNQLIGLVGQLTESMLQLTTELRALHSPTGADHPPPPSPAL